MSTAIEAVLRAGEMQMASFGRDDVRVDMKGAIDLVTEVDVAVERMFHAFIEERFPDHGILAEELQERPSVARDGSTYVWIFDPIDGTSNYAHGLPIFCSSLGLEVDGRLEVGAVYDPTRKELYTAERGRGAFLNGKPLRVSAAETVLESMLVTGFPYDIHATVDEIVGLFGAFVSKARAVRRLGSAALDLCYVAAGRCDAFWEQRLKPWDIAAGALIVEEAGGTISGLDGSAFAPRRNEILASNGRIHQDLLQIIQDFYRDRPRAGNRT